MKNIEHVLTHFDDPLDYKHWIRVNKQFTSVTQARLEVEQAIKYDGPITLSVVYSEIQHSETVSSAQRVYVYLRTNFISGAQYHWPSLSNMRHLIRTTEQLLADWVVGGDYECPVNTECNELN